MNKYMAKWMMELQTQYGQSFLNTYQFKLPIVIFSYSGERVAKWEGTWAFTSSACVLLNRKIAELHSRSF